MEKTKNMFLTSAKELKTTSTLAVCAMLAALALILNSVASINIGPYVKIGFSVWTHYRMSVCRCAGYCEILYPP